MTTGEQTMPTPQTPAIARSRGLTVGTHNLTEFRRVPGMQIEDWL
jgi:predicted nucleic acid-binding protein